MNYPVTPDGRYFVHKGRLWRCTNPALNEPERVRLVKELMHARRAVKSAKAYHDRIALARARKEVDEAKIALGERGPTWWDDEVDDNRQLVMDTPYADWWSNQPREELKA